MRCLQLCQPLARRLLSGQLGAEGDLDGGSAGLRSAQPIPQLRVLLSQSAVAVALPSRELRHEALVAGAHLSDRLLGLAPLAEQRLEPADVGVLLLLQSRERFVAEPDLHHALIQIGVIVVAPSVFVLRRSTQRHIPSSCRLLATAF